MKANGLIDLLPDLAFWRTVLNEILEQFISAFDGKIDKVFWNNIYKGFKHLRWLRIAFFMNNQIFSCN